VQKLFEIVEEVVFDRKGLVEYMVDKPSQYPGNSGCRSMRDVGSDLKAVSNHHLSAFGLVLLTPA
jgi:hypothetical protein